MMFFPNLGWLQTPTILDLVVLPSACATHPCYTTANIKMIEQTYLSRNYLYLQYLKQISRHVDTVYNASFVHDLASIY